MEREVCLLVSCAFGVCVLRELQACRVCVACGHVSRGQDIAGAPELGERAGEGMSGRSRGARAKEGETALGLKGLKGA